MQGIGKCMPGRIENGEMIETRCTARRARAAFTLPGVKANVMVIAAGRDECSLVAITLRYLKTEDVTVEVDRTL
jgi:hypothetical protein